MRIPGDDPFSSRAFLRELGRAVDDLTAASKQFARRCGEWIVENQGGNVRNRRYNRHYKSRRALSAPKPRSNGGRSAMSITDQSYDAGVEGSNQSPRVILDLDLQAAQTLRAWLLQTSVDGVGAIDAPIINATLTQLARAVDTVQATVNIRHEFQQAGLNVVHWSDEQVLDVGRRIAEAARPVIPA